MESRREALSGSLEVAVMGSLPLRHPFPKGPKYLTIGYLGVFILGIVIMLLGRYLLIVGYLDP